MVTCFGSLQIYLFIIIIIIIIIITSSSFTVAARLFKPLHLVNGTVGCAVDNATTAIPLSELRIGIPPGVPDSVLCAFGCTGFSDCTSFNYRQSRDDSIDSGQCELYTTPPRNCTISGNHCQHFQVSSSSLFPFTVEGCRIRCIFSQLRRPNLCFWDEIFKYLSMHFARFNRKSVNQYGGFQTGNKIISDFSLKLSKFQRL